MIDRLEAMMNNTLTALWRTSAAAALMSCDRPVDISCDGMQSTRFNL